MFVKHALNIFMLYTPNHPSRSACLMSTTQAVFCRFQEYPTLDVSDQGSIRTVHLAFLPLTASGQCVYTVCICQCLSFTCLQVTKDSHELCGHSSPLLREWGLPGVDTAVTVSHIALRVCYYICGG